MARARTFDAEALPEADRLGELAHPRERYDLYGHESEAATMAQAARSGRLAHAWLIGGPKGVGKATLAWRFARALLVHGAKNVPDDLSVDPENPVARRIAALAHPDVMLVRRTWDADRKRLRTELPVEEIRRLTAMFSRHASEGGFRIAIVDAADEMNRAAENALLKTLEEPPRDALLLLIAHAPGVLLPTTHSRCRFLALRPLDAQAMDAALSHLAPEANVKDRPMLAALAEGSPGRALELAEVGGLDLYRAISSLLLGLPRLHGDALFALADKVARGAGVPQFVRLLGGIIQRTVRASFVPVLAVPGEAPLLDQLRRSAPLEAWMGLWENLRAAAARADELNLDKKQLVLNAFFEIEALAGRPAR